MRCPRCGNENPEANRFCGMCGTTLLAPAPLPSKPQAVSVGPAPVEKAEPEPSRTAPETVRKTPPAVVPEQHTSISGPSFLGLNDPPPSRPNASRRASISIDPDRAPAASNLHYLLEDEEEHGSGSGLWKFVFIVIALGLAVGFGYLRWKKQGLAWLNPSATKPSITEQQSSGPDGSAPAPGASSAPATTPAAAQSAAPASSSITPDPQPANQGTQSPAPANGTPSPNASTSGTNSPPAAAEGPRPSDAGNTLNTSKPVNAASSPPADKSSTEAANSDDEGDSNETAAPRKPRAEPAPKPRPSVPTDAVAEARKYLYGKGAAQDCDRGIKLLKPAANSGNPKAMVEMGALYSAGLCTPRDLPTAYRWFALALRKEPDNQSVQTDLTKLWGEMTQPERQLAMKLSQ